MERLTNFPGEITACSCSRQPKHLERFKNKGEHAVECCPCQVRTAFYPTAQEAIAEWEQRQFKPIERKRA